MPIPRFFMSYPLLMTWINRIYSFIHIPGSIAFLLWLFYYSNTRNRLDESQSGNEMGRDERQSRGAEVVRLYESRRRTTALCNLLAFVIFTAWPCMPPRLLSADTSEEPAGRLARTYGFVDTVHGPGREGSIWTDNRFTNKFAAMPSLHFGYSLLIGLTVATIDLSHAHASDVEGLPGFRLPGRGARSFEPGSERGPSWNRIACCVVGFCYPAMILVAIIATANHFILDAVVGSLVVGVAWFGNGILLNLLVIEDYVLWVLRIHKPEHIVVDFEAFERAGAKGVLRR
jgi:hypothetical protein